MHFTMRRTRFRLRSLALFAAAATGAFTAVMALPRAGADEGMWLFNAPPLAPLKQTYGFEPSPAWLEKLQKASVRFNSGGSGSFVSAGGLVITNHHVGADALQKFGDAQHNYLRDGFYARTPAEEKKCLDLELNVLMSMEDVTARVNAAVKADLNAEAALAARRAVIADIEKESKDKTGLRSDVVTLFQGGLYHLYRFKRYDDVRLVFAPEQQIAFYGGDPDNFEYPRFNLDICIFRAYENGQPAPVEYHLRFNPQGPADGELTFVSGHPGRTDRQLTVAELADARDHAVPRLLARLYRRETLLTSYGGRSLENARQAREDLFGIQNSRKAREGQLGGLLDPDFFGRLQDQEAKLRDAFANAEGGKHAGALGAYERIERAGSILRNNARIYDQFERGAAFNSRLFRVARTLLRAGVERPKPNGERLPEFRESSRPSLELQLFSEEPLYDDYETLTFADSLTDLAGQLGAGDPLVQAVLNGKSPRDRAAELVKGTKLKDVAVRKRLYEGGVQAVTEAKDPMIELAAAIDATARATRKVRDEQDEVQKQAYGDIARARFAIEGASTYPDATFTLRLSYGPVKGYEENGQPVPAQTNFAGLYARASEHNNQPPFDLPPRWVERRGKLNLDTPFNFVTTADIIGGNSGSPVVNRNNEFVGIIFDGNLQSLPLDYAYTEKEARAVSVNSRAILEALRQVYDAGALAEELTR